jgi:hypothetical protein
MKKILTTLLVLFCAVGAYAQQSPGKDHSKLQIRCQTCHNCGIPTKDEPCWVACPRENMITIYLKPEQTDELIIIDHISDRYGPVYFSHKLHAQMSVMYGGCENCHHHNTLEQVLKCNSCHEPSRQREDVSIPDLKGAYHRQCVDCHREWSHETGCNVCHTLKKNLDETKHDHIRKRYAGKNHPPILEPTDINYQTNSDKGKIVTFYHDDHTQKFGLKCSNCHKQEGCTSCHDVNKVISDKSRTVSDNKTFEEHHKRCMSCHTKDEQCSSCHSNTRLESFNHTVKTGWVLNEYHVKLSCVRCHGSKLPYKKVDNNCSSCHQGWNKQTFKHSVTGLQLNETHLDLGCEDCHLDRNFAVKPNCKNCHEDYSFPKQKPGKLIGK